MSLKDFNIILRLFKSSIENGDLEDAGIYLGNMKAAVDAQKKLTKDCRPGDDNLLMEMVKDLSSMEHSFEEAQSALAKLLCPEPSFEYFSGAFHEHMRSREYGKAKVFLLDALKKFGNSNVAHIEILDQMQAQYALATSRDDVTPHEKLCSRLGRNTKNVDGSEGLCLWKCFLWFLRNANGPKNAKELAKFLEYYGRLSNVDAAPLLEKFAVKYDCRVVVAIYNDEAPSETEVCGTESFGSLDSVNQLDLVLYHQHYMLKDREQAYVNLQMPFSPPVRPVVTKGHGQGAAMKLAASKFGPRGTTASYGPKDLKRAPPIMIYSRDGKSVGTGVGPVDQIKMCYDCQRPMVSLEEDARDCVAFMCQPCGIYGNLI